MRSQPALRVPLPAGQNVTPCCENSSAIVAASIPRERAKMASSAAPLGGISQRPHICVIASARRGTVQPSPRSEEHTSELQSLMRTSYAVFCLTHKTQHLTIHTISIIQTTKQQ